MTGLRKFAIFLAVSFTVLAAYQICLGEVLDRFPNLIQSRGVWLAIRVGVPAMAAIGIATVLGIWQREVGTVYRMLSVIWCLVMPPLILVAYYYFACFILHSCF